MSQQVGDFLLCAGLGDPIGVTAGKVCGVFGMRVQDVGLPVDEFGLQDLWTSGSTRVDGTSGHECRRGVDLDHKGDAMKMWLKRIGMVLGCVLALIGGAVVGMTALAARVVPQQEALRVDRVMTVGELMPLRAIDRVLIIDVRGSGSFASGHIARAIHVPLGDLEAQRATIRAAAAGRLVVPYCSCPAEASSLRAVQILETAGITAKALVGGFPRWVEAGGEVERQ